MSFEDEMTEFEQMYQDAPTENTNAKMPDGVQQATIKIARVEPQGGERSGWRWALMFANAKGTAWHNMNLDNETGIKIARQTAAVLGYEGSLSGLREACESGQFIDLVCEIKVETKPGNERDFTNVYMRRLLGKAEPGAGGGEVAVPDAAMDDMPPGGDDDIPF